MATRNASTDEENARHLLVYLREREREEEMEREKSQLNAVSHHQPCTV